MPAMRTRIVSTWDLDTFEDYYCGLRVGELIVST